MYVVAYHTSLSIWNAEAGASQTKISMGLHKETLLFQKKKNTQG